MSRPGMRHLLVTAALFSPLTLISTPALAGDELDINAGEVVVLDGTRSYQRVTVFAGGTLRVRPVVPGEIGSGTLVLKADEVTVAAGGVIDATAAGYPGSAADGGAPACCPAASGGAGIAGAQSSPGGGGGSGGKGAPGCLNGGLGTGGPGGQAYATLEAGNPGAAGGAAFFAGNPPDIPNRGGRGGGSITIRAALVRLEGTIQADGAPGLPFGGTGTGGGAGGFVSIDAVTILGSGLITARGGAGSVGLASSGGGGGGGVVRVSAAAPMGTTVVLVDVSGGVTNPDDITCQNGELGSALVVDDETKDCIDADGDGDPSALCMAVGTDCDDSDPTVRGANDPGLEVCDGLDNDCNGEVDDDLVTDACPGGQSCQAGACVADGAGGSGGGGGSDSGAEPDYLDYRGACSTSTQRAAHVNGAAFFGAALLAFLAALRARRRK